MKKYCTPIARHSVSTTDVVQDYYASHYAAEIVNAFTNIMFLYLGLRGLYNCVKHGHDRIFMVTFLGYLLVGFGSFCFHSTLKCGSIADVLQKGVDILFRSLAARR